MCGNNLDESIMSIANGWWDSGHDRDVDIDCSENVGKKSTFMAFNCNDGESNITLGHGWRDLDRDFDIDCSGKVGKNSTSKGFNYGEEGWEEDQSEVVWQKQSAVMSATPLSKDAKVWLIFHELVANVVAPGVTYTN